MPDHANQLRKKIQGFEKTRVKAEAINAKLQEMPASLTREKLLRLNFETLGSTRRLLESAKQQLAKNSASPFREKEKPEQSRSA